MSNIRGRFIEILECWTVDVITDSARFIEELGCDSLDALAIVSECEEEFGLVIPDEEAEKLTTVDAVVRYLEDRQSEMSEPL